MKIIVPIDFSDNSIKALEYATALATYIKSDIKLLHVLNPITYDSIIRGIVSEEIADKRTVASEELKRIIEDLRTINKDVNFNYEIVEGETVSEIINCSSENEANLIVMGTHGAGGLKKLFFGSNTASVIEQSICPVIAIPEHYQFRVPKKIVFPTNYEASDLLIVQQLSKIAEKFKAEINVLHIIDDEDNKNEKLEAIKQFLLTISEKVSYSKISYKLFNSKDIQKGIESVIEQEGADMIALSTHKRNFLKKIIDKSITKELSFHTKIPLIAFSLSESTINF